MSTTDNTASIDAEQILRMLRDGQSVAPELQEIFCEEAEDHLRSIYDGLDRLQVNGSDHAALADIRRASHTLKGAAGAVGVQSVTRLSHRMEDLLDDLAENAKPSTPAITLLLLSTADRLQELTAESFDLDLMTQSILEIYQQYHEFLPTAGKIPTTQPASDSSVAPPEMDDEDDDDPELAAALAAFGGDLEDDDDEELALLEAALAGNADSTTSSDNGASESSDQESIQPEDTSTGVVAPTKSTESKGAPADAASIAESVPSKGEPHIRVPLSRLDEMVRLVGEMIINRSAFAQRLGDFTSQIDDMQVAAGRLRNVSNDVETRFSVDALKQGDGASSGLINNPNAAHHSWATRVNDQSNQGDFDELEFDRYTEFHLLARTLSEATGDVSSIARECRNLSGDFDALLGRWQRLTRDAQDRLLQIRMVPLRTAVPRLGRAVRTTASQCGKSVQFVVRGDHTELDKTVLEEIADPLLHLVRNAVDHGIETPERRILAGKNPEATLTIEAVNQGTQLTLRVEDDGAGLDVDRIRDRAIKRGLISAEQNLSTDDIQRLIFAPGFSTADALTDVSGRGVGMDIVRETVQRLKGTIRLDSTPGKGARFTIILPTTLAVTRALVVECVGGSFAVPMQAISQISRLEPSKVRRIGDDAMVEMETRTVRLSSLAETLGLSGKAEFDATKPMLVIESGDRSVAFVVDNITGGQDIVVKSLGDHLRKVPGVIGATIRGDGSVIPILNPAELVGLCRSLPSAPRAPNLTTVYSAAVNQRRNVMVVDDSVSVRRITASVMRSGGWAVSSAKDGVDALEQLNSGDSIPSVILLDMEMPRMDGLELLSHLRASAELKDIPVVMVTSRAGDKHRKRAMQAGAAEYVVKPFRDDQLLAIATRLADRTLAEV